ncbi:RES domain-containing protein [[Kitasatospora] papulosa]|uniref:RES domain-containing protein n=1 Tax=Streptomyces TaxID=1883 RepID=UPI0036342B6A
MSTSTNDAKRSKDWVCPRCVDEDALSRQVEAAAVPQTQCGFCEGTEAAAPVELLAELFLEGVRRDWAGANDEGAIFEGECFPDAVHTWDLIHDKFGWVFSGDGLHGAVYDALTPLCEEDQWVERLGAGASAGKMLNDGWAAFERYVKHNSRYVFLLRNRPREERDFGEYTPEEMLQAVRTTVDFEYLYEGLGPGDFFWRARTHSSKDEGADWRAEDLGTSPIKFSKQANRMSPAGIPMFYGAEDLDTAIREVLVRTTDAFVTAGRFEVHPGATVIDFTRLKDPVSIFDPDEEAHHVRPMLIFLHHFVEKLSRPARPSYEQVDYVPTQIVTDFLLNAEEGLVDGLIYRSAITGKKCIVLKADSGACLDPEGKPEDSQDLNLIFEPATRTTCRIVPGYERMEDEGDLS